MRLCCGWGRAPLNLSPEHRYFPEQLMGMLAPYFRVHPDSRINLLTKPPIWINFDDQYINLETEEEIYLACRLASIYHNGPDCRAPPDDGWEEETAQMELNAEAFANGEGGADSSAEEQGDYVKVETG